LAAALPRLERTFAASARRETSDFFEGGPRQLFERAENPSDHRGLNFPGTGKKPARKTESNRMEKPELLRKLEKLIDEAERESLWGSLEIDFRRGKVTLVREHKTALLETGNQSGDPHADKYR
jgi:hypothetical protein